MKVTSLVIRQGTIKGEPAVQVYGGSAAKIVAGFADLDADAIRLKIQGDEEIDPPGELTVIQFRDWLNDLRTRGYIATMTDAAGEPAYLS